MEVVIDIILLDIVRGSLGQEITVVCKNSRHGNLVISRFEKNYAG